MREPLYEDVASSSRTRFFDRIVDGFRRDPNQRVTPEDPLDAIHAAEVAQLRAPMLGGGEGGRGSSSGSSGGHRYDVRAANLQTAQSHLARKLKGRHLQMIAIGGSIGGCSLLSWLRILVWMNVGE